MLVASRVRLLRVSRVLRAGGADDAKPVWVVPGHKATYQPTIPDKHFYTGHWNYAPATLWLRARRPAMEKAFFDTKDTVTGLFSCLAKPMRSHWDSHLPGIGFKALGVVGVLLGYNVFVSCVVEDANNYFFLERLQQLRMGAELQAAGFFRSESEEDELRLQQYNLTVERLEREFDEAIQAASETRDFTVLIDALGAAVDSHADGAVSSVPKPVSWRLNSMPYGRDNPDATTFAFHESDTPASGTALFLDAGSVGDYSERQDNKPNPIRKARHYYSSAYMPPTK